MKQSLDDLAIFGGTPAFPSRLHVGRPNLGNRSRLLARINDLLDRRWLTNNGPYVQEFEARIAEVLGVKHCIAICNGTIALEIMIRAAGLRDEVIIPAMTFVATAHALQWQGITPVFCDIDPKTHNIDPNAIEMLITPRTSGIIGVHLWGRPCEVESLADIARRRNLTLLYDAAHAFGCSHSQQMLGNFGEAEVLSFHATKFINSFEGGAIVTNNDGLATKAQLMRNFGFVDYDRVVLAGTNGKMSEVSAAMGLTLLESMNDIIALNQRHYQQYQQELTGIPGIRLIPYDETEKCNYQYIVLEIDEAATRMQRDQLIDVLWAENILARRYFYPGCHQMEPYRSSFLGNGYTLPETEKVLRRVLTLPTGTAVSCSAVSEICQIIGLVIGHGREVHEKLKLSVRCRSANE